MACSTGKRLTASIGLSLALTVSLAASQGAMAATGQPAPAATATAASADGGSFQDLNGFMWFYNTYFDYKYKDITKNLDTLKRDGIRVLGFFSPYDGDKNTCDGCDPLNYYTVSPRNGTLQDWKNLIAAAHGKGMKVVAYFVNGYLDSESPYFKTAEKQYAAGDRTSREVSSFVWTDNPAAPLPTLRMGPPGVSSWAYSNVAHAFYWKLWFGPGFDYDVPGSTAEVARIEKFWLDTGLDGFMWDVGRLDSRYQPYAVTLPKTYTGNDKWLTFEMADATQAGAYEQFGLTSWFNYQDDNTENDYTRIVDGSIDANGLETALTNADAARQAGDTTFAWSIWGDDPATNLIPHTYPTYPDDNVMRVQEAALLAGAGILYGSGMYDQYIRWSPTLRANWDRVLRTVNTNPALLPSANRVRVPAGSDPKAYAMRRTSANGKQTALLVYNFDNTAKSVTIDLSGTGIDTSQQPKDLYNGGSAPAITGTKYTVQLPAYGFTMLQVSTG